MQYEAPFQVIMDETALHKIALHEVTEREVQEVLTNPNTRQFTSKSSGLPLAEGFTAQGRKLIVVFLEEHDDPRILSVVTAYEPHAQETGIRKNPRSRKKKKK